MSAEQVDVGLERELDVQTGGMVSQMLLANAREREAIELSLIEGLKGQLRFLAQEFIELYRLIEDGHSLPRYTLRWLDRFMDTMDVAEHIVSGE